MLLLKKMLQKQKSRKKKKKKSPPKLFFHFLTFTLSGEKISYRYLITKLETISERIRGYILSKPFEEKSYDIFVKWYFRQFF